MTGLYIVGVFLVLLACRFPLSFAMGITGSLLIFLSGVPMTVFAHRMVNAVNSYPVLAVPMFIFAGSLMNKTGITTYIFDFAKIIMGTMRGGLAQVNVIASLIFSGISGAALADVGGLGKIEIKAMKEQGYEPSVAAAITGASATIGPIFPPSIPLIIYATAAEASGARVLIAGVLPGLVITLMLMLQVYIFSRKYNYPRRHPAAYTKTWRARVLEGVSSPSYPRDIDRGNAVRIFLPDGNRRRHMLVWIIFRIIRI